MRTRVAMNIALFSAITVLTAACSKEPTTFVPNNVDTFTVDSEDNYSQASKLLQADYMFVLDTGYSMFNNKAAVQDSLLDFAFALKGNDIDYRIGLVNGNIHNSSDNVANTFIGGTYLTAGLGISLENQIAAQIFPVGLALNQHREVLLEATRKVLSSNQGFLRSGASLVVVFVSDEDDESDTFFSNSSEAEYISFIKSRKDSALIKGRSIVKGINAGCSVDTNQNEEQGNRLANVAVGIDALETNRVNVSRCSDDTFDDILQNLSTDVSKPTDVFALQGSSPDISSLKVYLNGVLQQQGANYAIQGTKVVFNNKPNASSSVVLRYQPKYILSNKPNPSSISVVVDGASVSESSSNGWTYSAGENRIVFHGSSVPAHESEVKVSYTIN